MSTTKFQHRMDITDEVSRVYVMADLRYVIQNPVACYSTPGLWYEGIQDTHGILHIVPVPGSCPIVVNRAPNTDEPLE